ncbi:MAG: FG-GAP-like repeat-containing protein, partial [Bacteroidota bacterium]
LVADGDPNLHYHWNRQLADALQAKMAAGEGTPQQQIDTWYAYCKQLLLAGEPQACIDQLEGYFAQSGQPYAEIIAGREQMFELLALAYLRLGEQENCQQAHTPYACILPLQEEGVHQLRRGSEKAAELYTLLLNHRRDPKNAWLLNLASMTLGEHPQGLPPQHRIDFPNQALEQRDFPRFEEVALHVGLAADGLSGGCIVEDFDNDGWLDVFATSYGMEDQVKLFRNNGQGAFEDATMAAGLEGIVSGLNCLQADYDNDGWTDILILRGGWLGAGGHHPNSLLKNLGNGKFRDVTRSSGLLSLHPTQTAAWADFDRDGFLDLFIGNESTQGEQHACELFLNRGDGTFLEVADHHGLGQLHAFVKGVTWGDINNDGWPDLYVSVVDGPNRLYRNDQGTFTEIGAQAGVQEPYYSFPCWFWDVNNDGFQDLFVGGYDLTNLDDLARDYARELIGLPVTTEKPRLFINKGDGTFADETAAFGLSSTQYAMGANFGDLDNDGWLDYYAGTGAPDFSTVVPNRMVHNLGGQGFEEVTAAGNFGHIQKGHGIAFADLDRDGDQDIYQVMGGAFEGDNFT